MPLSTKISADRQRAWHILLGILGLACFAALGLWVARPLPPGAAGAVAAGCAGSALAGLALRGLRRKLFFGRVFSLHQSCSFEVVLQTARFLSPFHPRSALENEFIRREQSEREMEPDLPDSWSLARDVSLVFAGTLALGWIAFLCDVPRAALALGVLAAGVALVCARRSAHPFRTLLACLSAAAIAFAEGWIFCRGCAAVLPPPVGWTAYLSFTALLEVPLVPLGPGYAELPVLLPGFGPAFWPLALLHAARLLLLAPLGKIYFSRYKFRSGDFFDPNLVSTVRGSRRPPEGWSHGEWPADSPLVTLVIPASNEEMRLPGFLATVLAYMDAQPGMEVLVVDDGSRDRTAEIVGELAARDPRVRLARQTPNQGKGAAVRRGILEAAGRYVLFADADGATPIAELDRFRPLMASDQEIVIGSRKRPGPGVHRERQGLRSLMGSVFYGVVNLFAVPGIRDTQCGFKLFRRDVARALFPRVSEKGWAFDVEVLYLAQLVGFRVHEVGVNWKEVEGSKVSPLKDAIKMFAAVFRIRSRHAGFGRHDGGRP